MPLSLSFWSWGRWDFPEIWLSCFEIFPLLSAAQLASSSRRRNQDLPFQASLLSIWVRTPISLSHLQLCLLFFKGELKKRFSHTSVYMGIVLVTVTVSIFPCFWKHMLPSSWPLKEDSQLYNDTFVLFSEEWKNERMSPFSIIWTSRTVEGDIVDTKKNTHLRILQNTWYVNLENKWTVLLDFLIVEHRRPTELN